LRLFWFGGYGLALAALALAALALVVFGASDSYPKIPHLAMGLILLHSLAVSATT